MKRDAVADVVTQFSDSEDENHDVHIDILTDNADDASADMPGSADLLITPDWFCVAKPMFMG